MVSSSTFIDFECGYASGVISDTMCYADARTIRFLSRVSQMCHEKMGINGISEGGVICESSCAVRIRRTIRFLEDGVMGSIIHVS
jgi:hypothetical protein